ncbi:MAG TPA: peptide deformylase [Ignavibacteria bacterium]|nr:peptide deformylase [Ignavibacteria bacterium]
MPEQLPITTYGMEILRKKTKSVEKVDTGLIRLVENMFYTMDNAEGVGLAAPQVNENISLCIVDVSCVEEYKRAKPVTLINPVIVDKHGEAIKDEGCLSIPEVRGNVARADKIFVKYNDFDMNEVTQEFEGFFARVVQHEMDHLNGVLFVDHLDEDEKKKVASMLRKIKKNKVITSYPLFLNEIHT